ncbi:large subunit ribosomal protein L37Ae [Methanohalophilus levihalophilus]|uniref:50S ribosomal protein L37ae n=1 Tax=Methanohalophilus levihalophilus TaxID=1431282 RepID=UPI001AEA57A2|nr:50S ribosomal protein L37ae [Methanohalophilus levihalophilus]MBP2029414.1 large subunit ribosomal protein L37Ae [Methanohalophilus levihalophilus]
MAKKYTKKGRISRSAGRFGTRYGRKDRKIVANIEERMHAPHKCNNCARPSVRRIGTGIWKCKKCGYTFAGGTYLPSTTMGRSVARYVSKATEQVE